MTSPAAPEHEHEPAFPTGHQYTVRRGDDHVTVVELGGGLRSCVLGGRELLDGFAETEAVASSRGQVLAPWPNRIDGGRYAWAGVEHQLALTEPARGNATHGLLRFVRWECVHRAEEEVALAQRVLPQPGYPFALEVQVRYALTNDGLEVTTSARNVGSVELPYASGQHPYLVPPGGGLVDACSIELEAETWLETDERGIPVGSRATAGTPLDLRGGRDIGELELDTAFTGLGRDADGRAAVRLRGPDGRGTELWLGAGYPWVQLFTGDTLAPDRRRRGLAVEPMTAPANAFRSGVDVIRLGPGEAASATWGMRPLP